MRSDNTAYSSPGKPVAAGGSQIQYQGSGSTIYSHHNLQPGTSTTTCTHTLSLSLFLSITTRFQDKFAARYNLVKLYI